MFYRHLIIQNNDENHLYLYVDFNYEFAKGFNNLGKKEKTRTIKDHIIKYIKEKNINLKIAKVFLVVGVLVIGSLFIQNYEYETINDSLEPKFSYVEHIDIFGNNKTEEDIFIPPVVGKEKEEEKTKIEEPTKNITSPVIKKSEPIKEKTVSKVTTPKKEEKKDSIEQPKEVIQPPTTKAEKTVTLYRYNGTIIELSLEDYVIGVVGGEMPASFNIEALKAQSVLARTYALKKMNQNQILKDDVSHQVYKDQNQLKQMWGNSFSTYYNKIKKAVSSTKGKYLSYNSNYIEAVYHSTSNGKTEDSIAVWGNSYPYLKSVDSHWDLKANSYLRETTKDFNLLRDIIGLDFNSNTNIEILSKTPGNRIDKIKIEDKIFTGIELRTLLGLRSADFDINIGEENVTIVTRGFGHGVGMSQYGANGMANEGYNYEQILSHYYPNTQLKTGS